MKMILSKLIIVRHNIAIWHNRYCNRFWTTWFYLQCFCR